MSTKGNRIEGRVILEDAEPVPEDLELAVYLFGKDGRDLGSSKVDNEGEFSIPMGKDLPDTVLVVVGPVLEKPKEIWLSSPYKKALKKPELHEHLDLRIPKEIWRLLLPIRICISGTINKVPASGGLCPVPMAKVEIFDVDREWCLWPFLYRWRDWLADYRVVRLPDLLVDIPPPLRISSSTGTNGITGIRTGRTELNPQPEPPIPFRRVGDPVDWLNPQPLPPFRDIVRMRNELARTRPIPKTGTGMTAQLSAISPIPEPPDGPMTLTAAMKWEAGAVSGSTSAAAGMELFSRLAKLTVSSWREPWKIFPRCFYSRRIVCETMTDMNGQYKCCFKWWPFHIRLGRWKFDPKPDIIVRVTQVVNGTEKVIYLDPYSSTRWNVNNATIDLFLDDPDILSLCPPEDTPHNKEVYFTTIGDDNVYKIDQSDGLYHDGDDLAHSTVKKAAYALDLSIHAQIGDLLAGYDAAHPEYYYRLSYSYDNGGHFKDIDSPLSDRRCYYDSAAGEWKSENNCSLGPFTVGVTPNLYRIRDRKKYGWDSPTRICIWNSREAEPTSTGNKGDGKYILRLEVFDKDANKLGSAEIDYLDNTKSDGSMPKLATDWCDLTITLDHNWPVLTLDVPLADQACGVVKAGSTATTSIIYTVSQARNRILDWNLHWIKGINVKSGYLDSDLSYEGTPAHLSGAKTVQDLLNAASPPPITTTCAFALTLAAQAHIRNGYGFFGHFTKTIALTVENCPDRPLVIPENLMQGITLTANKSSSQK